MSSVQFFFFFFLFMMGLLRVNDAYDDAVAEVQTDLAKARWFRSYSVSFFYEAGNRCLRWHIHIRLGYTYLRTTVCLPMLCSQTGLYGYYCTVIPVILSRTTKGLRLEKLRRPMHFYS